MDNGNVAILALLLYIWSEIKEKRKHSKIKSKIKHTHITHIMKSYQHGSSCLTVSERSRTCFPAIIDSNQDVVTLKESASGVFLMFQMLIKFWVSEFLGNICKQSKLFIYWNMSDSRKKTKHIPLGKKKASVYTWSQHGNFSSSHTYPKILFHKTRIWKN